MSGNRRFLLSYDASGISASRKQFEAFVASNRHVSKWVFLYDGAYFLMGKASIVAMATSFADFLEPSLFVLAEVQWDATTGLLNQEIWDWLNDVQDPETPKLL